MISRRSFLKLTGLTALAGLGLSSYAFAIEPRFRLEVTRYRLTPPGWPAGSRPVRIAAIADTHACDPWMPLSRIEEIVSITNALEPDLIVLLGDYIAGLRRFRTAAVPIGDWARAFGALRAPLGVRAILGNHDWWTEPEHIRSALAENGIPVMENDAERIAAPDGADFWLAGLGDQLAHPLGGGRFGGVDDLPGTLAKVTDDKPVILLAHEPDIFPKVPERVSLTMSGHTHGGQVNLPLLGRLVVPSRYGDRYAYGHIVEDSRHLIVSGGLGCSKLPVRFGVPPEVLLVELGGDAPVA
ncbi:MAG: metallophosphoesterase [Bauldia sp.]|uniref:metallophosphoesterase n=1 Tax=Bauldia sp. TaxID=2575872 RepID=UPI001D42F197|nr:metallophosphoesterase [Bauldia sp.]MCB1496359.1 metallophosphoesterase [Bauldia sp.]